MTNVINVVQNNISSQDVVPCLDDFSLLSLDFSKIVAISKKVDVDDLAVEVDVDLQRDHNKRHKYREEKIEQYLHDTQNSFPEGAPELSDLETRRRCGTVRFDSDAIQNGRTTGKGRIDISKDVKQVPFSDIALYKRNAVVVMSGTILHITEKTSEEIQIAEKALESIKESEKIPMPKSILKSAKNDQADDEGTNGFNFFCLCAKRK